MPRSILISGSLAFDLLLEHDGSFLDALDASALQHLSVCYNTPQFARAYGGNAVSTGWTLRLLGEKPLIHGSVGDDAQEYLTFLREGGVDTSCIAVHADRKTATCIIGSDRKGHQITFFHDGANALRTSPPTDVRISEIGYAIIAPTEPSFTLEMLRWCAGHGIPCLFDPGQRVLQFSPEQLKEAMGLAAGTFVNAYEADLLAGHLGLTHQKIARMTPFLVVTRDVEGFVLYEHERSVGLPRCDAETVVDPTGAGDAFRAGFLTGLLRKWPLEQCGMLGSAVGSKAVEHRGVVLPKLDLDELYARAEKAYGVRLPGLA